MCHGLTTGLNSVVELCLAAGVDPSLRINSRDDLDSCVPRPSRNPPCRTNEPDGALLQSLGLFYGNGRRAGGNSGDNDREGRPLPDLTRYTLRCYWTPLHVAAVRDDVDLLEMLLGHGASPNSAGIGVCPCYYQHLRRTLRRSHPEGFMENKHEFLERKLVTRWSPLHVAICNGHLNFAEKLIDRFGLAYAEESDDEVRHQAQWFWREEGNLQSQGRLPMFFEGRDRPLTPRFDPISPLHVAADKYTSLEAVETVYSMLKRAGCLEGPQSGVDILDAFGDTPFAVASFSGRALTFGSWLRDHGADIDFVICRYEAERFSIFNALCASGHHRDAMTLMDMGANVNKDNDLSDEQRSSPISNVCQYYNTRDPEFIREESAVLVRRLIHAGVDINPRSGNGFTPLMFAVLQAFPDGIRALLHAGADVHAVNHHDMAALHYAVQVCMRKSPREGEHEGFQTALATIQMLLDHGADPNYHSEGAGPPLFTDNYRIWTDDDDFEDYADNLEYGPNSMASIAPLMISKGADPNIYLEHPGDLRGTSLVVSAFYLGEYDSLDALITSGAIVTRGQYLSMMRSLITRPDRLGRRSGSVDALFRILNGPSMKLEEPDDRKHIMNAWEEVLYHAVGRRPSLVHDLAQHVVLTDVRGLGGKNVLHLMARWERHPAVDPDEFKDRINKVMDDLLQCGAYRLINEPDSYGQSPLQTAVDLCNIPVAIKLISHGADYHSEAKNPDGTVTVSPLRSAIRIYSKKCFYEMATEMLLLAGLPRTKMDLRNARYLKDFVLHLGGSSFDERVDALSRTTSLMKQLISLGVDVDETDEDRKTPLHLLFHLLESTRGCSQEPGSSPIAHSSGNSTSAVNRAAHSEITFGTDRPRMFDLRKEEQLNMNGQPNSWDSESESDTDAETLGWEDGFESDEPELGTTSEAGGAASPSTQIRPVSETGELVENGDDLARARRCEAWISSFLVFLVHGASLTARNDAGKTALDYIDELRDSQAQSCPKMYGPVISALRDFVKRPPFDPELLAKLDDTNVEAKGMPLLVVHNHIWDFMDKYGREDAHEIERQACAKSKSCWVPFW